MGTILCIIIICLLLLQYQKTDASLKLLQQIDKKINLLKNSLPNEATNSCRSNLPAHSSPKGAASDD